MLQYCDNAYFHSDDKMRSLEVLKIRSIIKNMTLAHRNNVIKISLVLSFGFAIFILVLGIFLLTSKSEVLTAYTQQYISDNQITQSKIFLFAISNKILVLQNILYPIYTFAILLALYFLFEKTYVIEVSFFIYFAFLLSFDAFKLLVPYCNLWTFSPKLVLLISKFLYFSHFASVLLLLFAAVFILVPFTRRMFPMLFAISFLAVAVTVLTPFNTTTLTLNFLLEDGLRNLSVFAFWFFTAAIILTYFIAGKTLNAGEYVSAAWSMLFLLAGYFFMTTTATMLMFIAANAAFVLGVCFYLRSIHSYNLWQ